MSEKRTRLNLVLIVTALLLVGFAGGYYARVPLERGTAQLKSSLASRSHQKYLNAKFVGKPAVGIDSVTLDGAPFSLSDTNGRVVLLFFWASWCPYSRNAFPAIQAIQDRYAGRDDFQIIGVSLDRNTDALNDFVGARDIRWVNLYENGKAWSSTSVKSYEVRAIPSRWVIDRNQLVSGAELSQAAAEDLLSVLLENKHREKPAGVQGLSGIVEGGGCSASDAY